MSGITRKSLIFHQDNARLCFLDGQAKILTAYLVILHLQINFQSLWNSLNEKNLISWKTSRRQSVQFFAKRDKNVL